VAQILGFAVVIDNDIPALTASTTGGPVFGSLQHSMVYRQVRNAGLMRWYRSVEYSGSTA
jgi:hypothetical protein